MAPVILVPFRFHWYVNPVPVFALNVTDPPVQIVVDPAAVMVAVGNGLIVTVMLFEVAPPHAFDTTQV